MEHVADVAADKTEDIPFEQVHQGNTSIFLRPSYRKSPCKLWIKGCFTLEAGRNKGMLSAVNWLIIKVACFYLQKAVVKGRQVCNAYVVEHSPVASPL